MVALVCPVSSTPPPEPLPLPPLSHLAAFVAGIALILFATPFHPREAALLGLLYAGVAEVLPHTSLGPELEQRRAGLAVLTVLLLRACSLAHVIHGVLRLLVL